jgi:transcriptional regulator with XRE-family HTH domain
MVDKNRNLVLALMDNRFTQRELARRSGVHETRLSLIVNGRLIPSENEAGRIAQALKRKPLDLFREVA